MNENQAVVLVPVLSDSKLHAALARIQSVLDGDEVDSDGRRVVVEMYYHEGEFYAHAYANAKVEKEWGVEGSASSGALTSGVILEALENMMDEGNSQEPYDPDLLDDPDFWEKEQW